MKSRGLSFILCALLWLPAVALGQDAKNLEKVGFITFEDILLRPTYVSNESAGGEFNFNDSGFKVRWQKDANISATIGVGSVSQKNVSAIYSATPPVNTLGF